MSMHAYTTKFHSTDNQIKTRSVQQALEPLALEVCYNSFFSAKFSGKTILMSGFYVLLGMNNNNIIVSVEVLRSKWLIFCCLKD